MASWVGKVCFWCESRCFPWTWERHGGLLHMWIYFCLSFCMDEKMLQMSSCIPRCEQSTRMANRSTRTDPAITLHVKSRWKGAECKRGGKTGETKQGKLQKVQMHALSLHVQGFFLIISRKPVKWRRRLECLSKWKIATIPCCSCCNHFNPSPVHVPGCVDRVKQCDASCCMTN